MQNKSFTLIELLVVIVIIGILAGVIIVSVSSSINKANFAKAQAFSNTVQNELLGDLVSEWTFDNPSLPGEDTWGNNDGTVGATYVPKADRECVYGGCYEFDGIDDYINCGKGNLNNMSKMTFSAWIKPFSLGGGSYGRIFQKQSTLLHMGTTFYSDRVTTDGAWHLDLTTLNEWSFIVFIYDNSSTENNTIMYTNGNKEIGELKTTPVGLPVDDSSYDFFIGNGSVNGSRSFDGYIDDVRIYNVLLSSAQIKQQYVAGINSLLANNNISKEEYNLRIESLSQK